MKKILISVFLVLVVVGCKSTSTLACEDNDTFTIEFTNGSSDTYDIYINNVLKGSLLSKKKITYDVPSGFSKITVTQKTGYILFPTTKTYENNGKACETRYLVFP